MHRSRVIAVAVALMLALSGCGGSKKATQAPAKTNEVSPPAATAPTAPTTTPAKEVITVKVGGTEQASLKNLPMFLTGFADDESLNIEYTEYKGGSEVAKALLNGEVDMAFVAASQVLRDKSGELRLLSMVTNGPGHALVIGSQYKGSISSVKDLEGKKVGVSSLGSGPDSTLKQLLKANGIDPKNVQILPVGHDINALSNDKVVAMVTIEPFITMAVQSGKGHVLVDARKPEGIQAIYGTPAVPWIALATRVGFAQDSPEAAQRMVNMVSKSLKFISSTPAMQISERTPSFFKKEVNGDESLFTSLLEENKGTFSSNGDVDRKALEGEWKKLQNSGAVPKDKPFAYDELVISKFQTNAPN